MRLMYAAPPAAGGIRSHVVELVRHFSRDNEVLVLSPADSQLEAAVMAGGGFFYGSKTLSQQFFAIRRILRAFKPDLIHLHGYKAELLGRMAALGAGLPLVVTLHNYLSYTGSGPLPIRAFCLLQRLPLSPVNGYITVSQALKEEFLRWNDYPAEKVTVIYNGIRPGPFEKARPLPELQGLGKPLIGATMRLARQKGADILVEAAPFILARYPGAALLISGRGPMEKELKEKAAAMGLKEKVHFLGYFEDLPGFLASLDLYVQPSRTEGLGITLLEVLSCGTPAVASAVGGIPEIITCGVHGLLVPPGDARELAAAVIRLAEDEKMRQNLGEKGKKRIKEGFLLKDMLEKTAAVYGSLLGEKVRG